MRKGDFVICVNTKTRNAYRLPITMGKEYKILFINRYGDMCDIVADDNCIMSFELYRFELSTRGVRNNTIDNVLYGL